MSAGDPAAPRLKKNGKPFTQKEAIRWREIDATIPYNEPPDATAAPLALQGDILPMRPWERPGAAAPWERQFGESRQAFAGFVIYRDMPDHSTDPTQRRSIRNAAKRAGRNKALFTQWSSRWAWPERALLWDAEQDRHNVASHRAAVERMQQQHAELAVGARQAIIAPIMALNRVMADPAKRERVLKGFEDLDPVVLVKLSARMVAPLDMLAKMERTARGMPAESWAVSVELEAKRLAELTGLKPEDIIAEAQRLAEEGGD